MRVAMLFLVCFFWPIIGVTDSTVTVPWQEFQTLYKKQLEDTLKQQFETKQLSPLYGLDVVSYQLNLAETVVTGRVLLQGKVLRGQLEPINLFSSAMTVTSIESAQNAELLSNADGYQLFTESREPFQIALKIAVPVKEDQQSRYIELPTPAAVKNALKLNVPSRFAVLEVPGLHGNDGLYYFAPGKELRVRFTESALVQDQAEPAVDTFTRIELQDDKLLFSSYFVPLKTIKTELDIALPMGRYVTSTLQPSMVEINEGQGITLKLPTDWQQPFRIEYESDLNLDSLPLPSIKQNEGREGEFQIIEPFDTRLTPLAEGLSTKLKIERLSNKMRQYSAVLGEYWRVPFNSSLALKIERFAPVSTPAVVLDNIHYYLSFAENGTALTVLRLQLPPAAGRQLSLQSVADAEIWSLTVNDQQRQLLQQQDKWIVPLAEDQSGSLVELAYLRKGDKLGLQGRLDFAIPKTSLAARKLNVAIALGERVQLVALEGELEPAKGKNWPKVKGFSKKAYYFSYPFYRGDGIDAAIYYKEPLEN